MQLAFELDYRELMVAQGGLSSRQNRAGSDVIMLELLRKLATAIGLEGRFPVTTLKLVSEELSKLRPLGDPRHSLRSAQVSWRQGRSCKQQRCLRLQLNPFCVLLEIAAAPGHVDARQPQSKQRFRGVRTVKRHPRHAITSGLQRMGGRVWKAE